jgi:hypothetical protein
VATISDSVTVICVPNPQIWYIEMVGQAARWTEKKKKKKEGEERKKNK